MDKIIKIDAEILGGKPVFISDAITSNYPELEVLLPDFLEKLKEFRKGDSYKIENHKLICASHKKSESVHLPEYHWGG